ncbi:BPSL0761 family protein [Dyella mobilis]|uniref:BPSL0761 family protein n=1 Tax=Dyella mobilis TaxID=1849582 RepID=UPI0024E0DC6F|nr:BPSL0761 family protein [Dyella mobilis]
MTLPDERTRALLLAGSFLIELARNTDLPIAVRQRAIIIARHFPTLEDVSRMAIFRHPSGFGVGLTTPIKGEWEKGYPCGPLLHSTRLDWPEEH